MRRAGLLLFVAVAGCGDNAVAPPDAAIPIHVHAIAPARGGLPGGTTIVIDGDGFDPSGPPPTVILGRHVATQVGVLDPFTITATTPPGELATAVDVTVATADTHARLDRAFTYNPQPTLTAIDPPSGPAAGGTHVTITGTGFVALDAGTTTVRFGDLVPTDVTIVSDTQITATTPPGPPFATVAVTVSNRNGAADPFPSGSFLFTARGLILGANRYGPPYGVFFLDPATGVVTRVRELAEEPWMSNSVHSLASDGTVLWGTTHWFSMPPQLFSFDPLTLATTWKGALVDPNGNGIGVPRGIDCKDLELAGGVLYCAQNGALYSIDPATIQATRVATVAPYHYSLATVGDTTYAVTGQCCAASTFAPIDLATGALGAATTITLDGQPLAVGASKATGFDGAIYFVGSSWFGVPAGGGPGRSLYRVDVATGAATLVARVPFQTTALAAVE